MAFRTYFYDLNRPKGQREMSEHPANGAEWSASGSMARDASGAFVPDTLAGVVVYSPRTCEAIRAGDVMGDADYMLGAEFGFRRGSVNLTASDFPGARVRVKVWCSGETIEFRELRADAGGN